MSRTVIESLITRQINQYNQLRAILRERARHPDEPLGLPPPPRPPVVAISRQAGCAAEHLAAGLADRLGVQVWDRELVDQIARDKGLRRELVAQLDEGLLSSVEAWVRGILGGRLFMRDDYAVALASTLKTLAETGGAVIVGRGAGFALGDRADLRVRLVAGEAWRAAALARVRHIGREQARAELGRIDAARAAFVRKFYKADVADEAHYDLVLNQERLETGLMVEMCEFVVRARRLRGRESPA
jgi:hypothetical protein